MKRLLLPILLLATSATVARDIIDISGIWQFNTGNSATYDDTIELPGSMLTRGKGDPVTIDTRWVGSTYDSSFYFNPYMAPYREPDNIKYPFFLTPDRHYVGNAWYSRSVDIPKSWKKGKVILNLERPHIETTVFVNGLEVGRDSSLSVPHRFDITPYVRPGQANDIQIRIYNGIENVCVGQDSHSVTDQTQGCWNGIVGAMTLQHRPSNYIENVQVFPDAANHKIKVVVNTVGDAKKHRLSISVADADGIAAKADKLAITDNHGEFTIDMGPDVKLWDEFEPNLYTLTATLDGNDTVDTTFGMRDITIDGRQIYVNGHPVWIRGTVGNCCFPNTGYPPTDVQSWLDIFNKCKEYGLNMMRFHSYCPPEAAFIAADRVGFYLQPEGPSWPNHGVKLGNGMSIDHYLYEETQRMAEEYGNHPSFCMLAAGNEPAGNWVSWVGDFVDKWRESGDNRRIYCGASVGGGWAWDPRSQYHVKGGARGLDWDRHAPQSTDDFYDNITSFTQRGSKPVTFAINEPMLSHEQGQWCAFPDLSETSQYTGAYKARNFEIFADLLRDGGMAQQADKFLHASGKLQTLAYKYEMERNLRTPEYSGFQILSLNDYSGQGTALVGVLNVFWREKGYCTADDWTQFCSPVVPLARIPKFVYTDSEVVNIPIELYNAYSRPLSDVAVSYSISDGANVLASDNLTIAQIPLGKNHPLLDVVYNTASLSDIDASAMLQSITTPRYITLSVDVKPADGPSGHNTWDLWVYPSQIPMPEYADIYVTDSLDTKALDILADGGKVLVTAAGKIKYGSDVKQTYLPVFWNTSWFKMRPPHTTGATIDTAHPLFDSFPTDDWANLNWWELINKAQVINMSNFPAHYQSPIQPIDTWHVSRKLGMMAEANVLSGKLLITTMDIDSDLDNRVVARQMRKAILDYMAGDNFNPSITLDPATITDLFVNEAPPVNMFTNESPDELKPKLK